MRVVIDARTVLPRRSGIGNYVEALIRAMVAADPELELLLLRHPSADGPIVSGEEHRVRELAFPEETKSLTTVFRMGWALDLRGWDLYHSPADLVPLGLGLPWVVTIHDLMWLERPELASAFLPERLVNGAWYRWNITRAVRGARRVVSISEATRTALGRVFPEELARVAVVPHGVDHSRWFPGAGGPRSLVESIVPRGQRYSLIVGQGSPYKNHLGMVRAFVAATADDPTYRLVLVRRFSRIDREMNALLQAPEVAAKVVLVPFVDDALLLALYAHAHTLLFASHLEGFGLPALEAMALGTPVLASTTPALREVTGDAALHAVSTDHADLVQKLRRIDRDENLRAELRRRGPERAREFRWSEAAERTLAVYRAAIAARG